MGCRFEFMLNPRDSSHDRYSVEAIADEMVELVHDWHDRLTVFSPESVVSRFNRHPVSVPMAVDRELFELLELCEALRIETRGAFNIASGTLMHANGFRDSASETSLDDLDLEHAIKIDPNELSVTRNDQRISIDFGAIAKGHVLDLIGIELQAYGIKHAFIHGGTSSSLSIGEREPSSPWKVRLSENPTVDATFDGVMGLGISDISGRQIESHDGSEHGHIMDPLSRTPVSSSISRIACTHQRAAIADAYSTALNVRPDLIDTLHNDECSIAIFDATALIRDRTRVFAYAAN